ncbi:MAG: hypothetical protein ACT4ON_13175 [Bacteroidota bacterium]
MKRKKITTENYFKSIEEIGRENLPIVLQRSHSVIMAKTDSGNDWSIYENEQDLKRMVDLTFKKLEEFIKSQGLDGVKRDMDLRKLERLMDAAKREVKEYKNFTEDQLSEILNNVKHEIKVQGHKPYLILRKDALIKQLTVLFQKEFEKLDTKTLYDLHDNALIIDGANADIIGQKHQIIKGIIDVRDNIKKKENPYSTIGNEIHFIQRFLDFHDKILYKKTFEIFIDELQKAIQEKKIGKKSPVAKDIIAIQQAAINAFNTMKNAKYFFLRPTTIKHLKSIIERFENAYDDLDETYIKTKKKPISLEGIPSQDGKIMSSVDFANLQFNTLGLKDKWLEFIGDPAPGFTAMVFGMPKMGKSYLCVDFAGYLARNHGKVLYIAKEEKLDKTLQDKLKDKEVAHPDLFVSDSLPNDLSNYEFIFLDSVNKLGLNPKDLEKLKMNNKGKSFIYIFQATKGGKFKGNNEFQHDVDVVIEVPEQGKAVQYGRYNQGGEMNIFENEGIMDISLK